MTASQSPLRDRRLYTRKAFLQVVSTGAVGWTCVGMSASCGASSLSNKLHVHPKSTTVDEPFTVRLRGLKSNQRVLLRADFVDGSNRRWSSAATFRADSNRGVDLAKQSPIKGSYSGTDPMGLVWSASGSSDLYAVSLHPRPIKITAEISGMKTSVTVPWHLLTPEIKSMDVRSGKLYGRLFAPKSKEPVAGVLVLGGSEGGLNPYVLREAALLATHGYAALALAYFGVDSLPKKLLNIPLEYFEGAIKWFQSRGAMRGKRLGVVGHSRGGELALLLGSHYSRLNVVVSYVGSGLVFPSPNGIGPAWTFRGKPVPAASSPPIGPPSLWPKQIKHAEIPVERINGPVLLISADADEEWPSTKLSEIAWERLKHYHHPYPDEFYHYQNTGHLIQPPYLPTTTIAQITGGTSEGNAKANEDSWLHVLRMFGKHLAHGDSKPSAH